MYHEKPLTQVQEIQQSLRDSFKNLPQSSKAYIKSLFPIAGWLPRYNSTWFVGDFIAGVTVALVVIPQAISYASKLANLPPEFGLYTSFIGAFIYAAFATSKDVTIGPTAVLCLLVGQSVSTYIPNAKPAEAVIFAISLSFWTGLIQLFVGLFRLGVVVDFVPVPVIAGFTSGAGIQIIIAQMAGLLGIPKINTNNAPYQVLGDTLRALNGVSKYDAIFGVASLVAIISIKYAMQHFAKRYPLLRFVGYLRNAIVLIIATGISYSLRDDKSVPFNMVKTIPYGLTNIQQANLSTSYAAVVFPAVPAVFIVSILEHIAVVKTYGRLNGYTTNNNQEIVAIGLTNFLGSFVGAFPATGSFSRSAIKSASGVRTPLGTFITGVLVVISLFTLTGVLYYIPNATLCAIVIAAISELFVNFKILKSLYEVELTDFAGFLIALLVSFVSSLENAIYAAVGWSVLVLLLRIARPKLSTLARTTDGKWINPIHDGYKKEFEKVPEGILVFKIEESLTYPNSSFFIDKLKETVIDNFRYTSTRNVPKGERSWSDDTEQPERKGLTALPPLRAVILDFAAVNNLDYTGLQALLDIRDDLVRYAGRNVPFHFVHVRKRQLNTLLRVPVAASASSVDATPGAPNQVNNSPIQGLLQRLKGKRGSSVSEDAKVEKALEYFHFTIDDAVEAAVEETREARADESAAEMTDIITTELVPEPSGFVVAKGNSVETL
ncbi:sulfate permease [Rhizoclosmatium globosum]|uniref:Sulfate permease n=1 Tax=Rhizoclosmatium globosum TaxID=329046 RepID=A0A1Y2CF66_9FUNG|nr:sulfate permease [Rhizoclosmatium globosum]|eukprot:ORY45708.1 sulfate permease [Rhizoclosmatium globosum]